MSLLFALRCSVAALVGIMIAKLVLAQTAVPFDMGERPADGQPSRIEIKGGVSGTWLIVGRANKTAPDAKGFDPSYTYLVSDFKPIVKKLRSGKYEIQFTCDICEGLP
jgi:hypothetical protein